MNHFEHRKYPAKHNNKIISKQSYFYHLAKSDKLSSRRINFQLRHSHYALLLTLYFGITIGYRGEFHNTYEFKKRKILRGERNFSERPRPLTRSAERTISIIPQQKMSILIISGRNWICRCGKRKMGGRILVITKQNVATIGRAWRVEDHSVTDGNEIRRSKLNYN